MIYEQNNLNLDTLTDNAIMLKVKAGDLDKMGLLFERYHRQLHGFLFHMTRHRELSEDMVQQVFYKMLKYRHTFTGSGEFIHWMYTISRNILKDQGRRKKLPMMQEGVEEMSDLIAGGTVPDEQLVKKQATAVLYKAMEKLEEGQKEILSLCRFQELKYREIGVIMGISETAVKTRIHRAMQELRTIYAELEC